MQNQGGQVLVYSHRYIGVRCLNKLLESSLLEPLTELNDPNTEEPSLETLLLIDVYQNVRVIAATACYSVVCHKGTLKTARLSYSCFSLSQERALSPLCILG